MSKGNTFAVVNVTGKEPVGAFSFVALDASDEEAAHIMREQQLKPIRRALPNEELSQRIRERHAIPFPVWDRKVRLSLAGYQDRLQVLVDGSRLALADSSLSFTPRMPFMVASEHSA